MRTTSRPFEAPRLSSQFKWPVLWRLLLVGPRLIALAKDELHTALERLGPDGSQRRNPEEMLSLDVEQQLEVFGRTISPSDEEEAHPRALRSAHEVIESASGPHRPALVGCACFTSALSGAECVYLE